MLCTKQPQRSPVSEDVQQVTYHKVLPLIFHGYVWPFLLTYSLLFCGWMWVYGLQEQLEGLFVFCAVIGALNIITCLFCVWSVNTSCKLTCLTVGGFDEDGYSHRACFLRVRDRGVS